MNFSFKDQIVNYFNIPEIKFSNLTEKTKYSISYYFMIASSIVCTLMSLLFLMIQQNENLIISTAALIVSFVSFNIVKHTKKHVYPSLFATIAIGFICQWSMYNNVQNAHVTEHIWIINNLLYSFFTLHFLWGVLLSVLHTISICIFYYFFYFERTNTFSQEIYLPEEKLGIIVNILLGIGLFVYFNWMNIKQNKQASKTLKNYSKQLQEQFEIISVQNDEKVIIIKEMHHRVKNNLQLIISLLRLQFQNTETIDFSIKINDSINRIHTISLLHENLYSSKNIAKVDFFAYFNTLCLEIIQSHQVKHQINHSIQMDVEEIKLKPIIPLGLIINELISNSIKHNLSKTDLLLEITMKKKENSTLFFEYKDNGVWKHDSKNNSFGTQLIEIFTRQLNGHLIISTEPITCYTFYFNNILGN
jgi:two-component system, sensor histidine kinase PdtaS